MAYTSDRGSSARSSSTSTTSTASNATPKINTTGIAETAARVAASTAPHKSSGTTAPKATIPAKTTVSKVTTAKSSASPVLKAKAASAASLLASVKKSTTSTSATGFAGNNANGRTLAGGKVQTAPTLTPKTTTTTPAKTTTLTPKTTTTTPAKTTTTTPAKTTTTTPASTTIPAKTTTSSASADLQAKSASHLAAGEKAAAGSDVESQLKAKRDNNFTPLPKIYDAKAWRDSGNTGLSRNTNLAEDGKFYFEDSDPIDTTDENGNVYQTYTPSRSVWLLDDVSRLVDIEDSFLFNKAYMPESDRRAYEQEAINLVLDMNALKNYDGLSDEERELIGYYRDAAEDIYQRTVEKSRQYSKYDDNLLADVNDASYYTGGLTVDDYDTLLGSLHNNRIMGDHVIVNGEKLSYADTKLDYEMAKASAQEVADFIAKYNRDLLIGREYLGLYKEEDWRQAEADLIAAQTKLTAGTAEWQDNADHLSYVQGQLTYFDYEHDVEARAKLSASYMDKSDDELKGMLADIRERAVQLGGSGDTNPVRSKSDIKADIESKKKTLHALESELDLLPLFSTERVAKQKEIDTCEAEIEALQEEKKGAKKGSSSTEVADPISEYWDLLSADDKLAYSVINSTLQTRTNARYTDEMNALIDAARVDNPTGSVYESVAASAEAKVAEAKAAVEAAENAFDDALNAKLERESHSAYEADTIIADFDKTDPEYQKAVDDARSELIFYQNLLAMARANKYADIQNNSDYAEQAEKGAQIDADLQLAETMDYLRTQLSTYAPGSPTTETGGDLFYEKEAANYMAARGYELAEEDVARLVSYAKYFQNSDVVLGGLTTEEQRQNYYYILARDGVVAAMDYAVAVNTENENNKKDRLQREELERVEFLMKAHPFAGAIETAAVPWVTGAAQLVGGLPEAARKTQQLLATGVVAPSASGIADWAEATNSMYTQALGDVTDYQSLNALLKSQGVNIKVPLLGDKDATFFYGVYSSAVQSTEAMAMSAALIGELGLPADMTVKFLGETETLEAFLTKGLVDVAFFGNAMNSTLNEAVASGMDTDKAIAKALCYGLNEALFETFSIEMLYDAHAATNIAEWALNTLIASGTEGSEEVFTDIANTLADGIINGRDSDLNQRIDYFVSLGNDHDTAAKLAMKEYSQSVLDSFLAGALSSVGSVGGSSAMQTTYASVNGKAYNAVGLSQVIADQALSYDFTTNTNEEVSMLEDMRSIAEKVKAGKANNVEVGLLASYMDALDHNAIDDLITNGAPNQVAAFFAISPVRVLDSIDKTEAEFLGDSGLTLTQRMAENPEAVVLDGIASEIAKSTDVDSDTAQKASVFLRAIVNGNSTVDADEIHTAITTGVFSSTAVQQSVYNYLFGEGSRFKESVASGGALVGIAAFRGLEESVAPEQLAEVVEKALTGLLEDRKTGRKIAAIQNWNNERLAKEENSRLFGRVHSTIEARKEKREEKKKTIPSKSETAKAATETESAPTETVEIKPGSFDAGLRDNGDSFTANGKTYTRAEYVKSAVADGKSQEQAQADFDTALMNASKGLDSSTSAKAVKVDLATGQPAEAKVKKKTARADKAEARVLELEAEITELKARVEDPNTVHVEDEAKLKELRSTLETRARQLELLSEVQWEEDEDAVMAALDRTKAELADTVARIEAIRGYQATTPSEVLALADERVRLQKRYDELCAIYQQVVSSVEQAYQNPGVGLSVEAAKSQVRSAKNRLTRTRNRLRAIEEEQLNARKTSPGSGTYGSDVVDTARADWATGQQGQYKVIEGTVEGRQATEGSAQEVLSSAGLRLEKGGRVIFDSAGKSINELMKGDWGLTEEESQEVLTALRMGVSRVVITDGGRLFATGIDSNGNPKYTAIGGEFIPSEFQMPLRSKDRYGNNKHTTVKQSTIVLNRKAVGGISAMQHLHHEEAHHMMYRMQDSNRLAFIKSGIESVFQRYPELYTALFNTYAVPYAEAYGKTVVDEDLADKINEEIVCDLYAGIVRNVQGDDALAQMMRMLYAEAGEEMRKFFEVCGVEGYATAKWNYEMPDYSSAMNPATFTQAGRPFGHTFPKSKNNMDTGNRHSVESLAQGVGLTVRYNVKMRYSGREYKDATYKEIVAKEKEIEGGGVTEEMIMQEFRDSSPRFSSLCKQNINGEFETIEQVTPEMIKNSPFGILIKSAATDGYIASDEDGQKQYQFFADMMNLMSEYKEVDFVWEVVGSQMFSAIKNNSDPQYNKTIDFSTICKKTKAMLDTMSETMKLLGRGLSKDEIKLVYQIVGEMGETTPCPVCYVFSRWMGVGSILSNLDMCQTKYGEHGRPIEELIALVEKIDALKKETGKSAGDLQGKYEKNWADALSAKRMLEANRAELAEIRDGFAKGLYTSKTEATKKQRRLDVLEQQIELGERADAVMEEMRQKSDECEIYKWALKARLKNASKRGQAPRYEARENYKDVPREILFDLNRTDEFAKNYPNNWAYRNTRGPSAGKAILPYSDARVGEILQGIAHDVKNIKTGESNPLLSGDTKSIENLIKAARKKQKRQNLIGGLRFQSTSDFRYAFASDYVMTCLELQAIGANVQLYTKVLEAVDFFATLGCDVNLSVMPKGKGFIETDDADGNKVKVLDFSSTTGINADGAIAYKNAYSNVQLIMVGINDEHIKLCLDSDDITFVIPFHGSGNSQKDIQELMNLLKETIDLDFIQDYTKFQTDAVVQKDNASRNLRNAIIGNSYTKETTTEEENFDDETSDEEEDAEPKKSKKKKNSTGFYDESIETLRPLTRDEITQLKSAVITYEHGKKEYKAMPLRDLYRRFYLDSAEVISYLNSDGTIAEEGLEQLPEFIRNSRELLELFGYVNSGNTVAFDIDKYYLGRENECYLNFLSGASVKQIFPYEYWDKSSMIENAGVNGRSFIAYCKMLGLEPRFSGYDSTAKKHTADGSFDFTGHDGYWKLLIDRRMYDKSGHYRAQQAINLGAMTVSALEDTTAMEDRTVENYSPESETFRQRSAAIANLNNEYGRRNFGVDAPWTKAVNARTGETKALSSQEASKENTDIAAAAAYDVISRRQAEYGLYGKNGRAVEAEVVAQAIRSNDGQEAIARIRAARGNSSDEMVDQAAKDGENGLAMSLMEENFGNRHSLGSEPVDIDAYNRKPATNPDFRYSLAEDTITAKETLDAITDIQPSKETVSGFGTGKFSLDSTDLERAEDLAEQGELFSTILGNDVPLVLTGSLFSGAGTFEQPLKSLIRSTLAVEYAQAIAAAYEANNELQDYDYVNPKSGLKAHRDINDIKDFSQFSGRLEYLHASPVCKRYSSANTSNRNIIGEEENELDINTARQTAKAIWEIQPRVFALENVKGYKNSQAMSIITDVLNDLGYVWKAEVFKASDYGAATSRERVILRAVRNGILPDVVKTNNAPAWDTRVSQKMRDALPSTDGQGNPIEARHWMLERLENFGYITLRRDKRGELIKHRSIENGTAFDTYEIADFSGLPIGDTLVYGRYAGNNMSVIKPGEVCKGFTAKQEMPRVFSVTEEDGQRKLKVKTATPEVFARLMGLPEDFKLPSEKTNAYTIIGNGVPTELTYAVVEPLLQAYFLDCPQEMRDNGYTEKGLAYEEFAKQLEENRYAANEEARSTRNKNADERNESEADSGRVRQSIPRAGGQNAQSARGQYSNDSAGNNRNSQTNNWDYRVNLIEDQEYLAAVNSGDYDTAKQMFSAKFLEQTPEGITPFLFVHNYSSNTGHTIAKAIKSGADDAVALEIAATDMSKYIPDNAVLIPIPSSKGYATDTLDLANAISEKTSAPVIDALIGKSRASQYITKRDTGKAISAEDMLVRVREGVVIPEDKIPIFIDNVVATGNTAKAAHDAVGRGEVLCFAYGSRSKPISGLKVAEAITYDRDGNVIPLSQRFDIANPGIRYSLDSEGNELSAEQIEFFKDSKIRDENGNLRVVYHGTDADFTVFDRTKGRSTMDINGFFFSPWEIDAGGYGNKVGAYYLNITNPASESEGYRALRRFQGQNGAGVKAREYLESLGYDGVNNGDEEYVAFYPEQIKLVSNTSPTDNADVRYSLSDSNLGYHAGDLGKAEYLSQQGSYRGTGHFGTGTYFVGEEEKVTKASSYSSRPQHAADFTDYNLFKVRNDKEGYALHDALRYVDGGIDEKYLDVVRRDWSFLPLRLYDITEASDLFDKTGWDRDNRIKVYTQLCDKYGYAYDSIDEWKAVKLESDEDYFKYYDGEDYSEDDILDSYEEYVKEAFESNRNEEEKEYKDFRKAFENLQSVFNYKNAKLYSALYNVVQYQKTADRLGRVDSYATVFMKSMGYDGVDVRGTGLDNTTYGSVIYDLKPETVKYSLADELDNPYSYEALIAKPNMVVPAVAIPEIELTESGAVDIGWLSSQLKSRCEHRETKSGEVYFLPVKDIKMNASIVRGGVQHGVFATGDAGKATQRSIRNAKVTLALPEILQNAIEVNRGAARKANELNSHILVSMIRIDDGDAPKDYVVRVLINELTNREPALAGITGRVYSIDAKEIGSRSVQSLPEENDLALTSTYEVSIADLLAIVKDIFKDTFSTDVYTQFEMPREVSKFSSEMRFSLDDQFTGMVYDASGNSEFNPEFAYQFDGASTILPNVYQTYSAIDKSGYTYTMNDDGSVTAIRFDMNGPEAEYIESLRKKYATSDTYNQGADRAPYQDRDASVRHRVGGADAGLRSGTSEVSPVYQERPFDSWRESGQSPAEGVPQSGETQSLSDYLEHGLYSLDPELTGEDLFPIGSMEQIMFDFIRNRNLAALEDRINEAITNGGYNPQGDVDTLVTVLNNIGVTSEEREGMLKTIDELGKKFGFHRPSEKSARQLVFPRKIADDRNTRRFAQNAATSGTMSNFMSDQIMRDMLTNELMSYSPTTDREAINFAEKIFHEEGIEGLRTRWNAAIKADYLVRKQDVAIGEKLLVELGNAAAYEERAVREAKQVATDLCVLGTTLGQSVQAFRLLKKMTPEGQLYYTQKMVQRLNKQYEKRIAAGKMEKIVLPDAEVVALMSATTEEEINKAMDKLKQAIADQIPATLMDKWNAWRFLAMLGNPKTHLRNMLGNGAFSPIAFAKDLVALTLEQAVDPSVRTKNWKAMWANAKTSEYKAYAEKDWEEMSEVVSSGGRKGNKYRSLDDITAMRKLWSDGPIGRALNWATEFNSSALEQEDVWFMKRYYVQALAQYLAARGIDEATLRDGTFGTTRDSRKLLNEARAWAMREAQRNTYHDFSSAAAAINQLKRSNGVAGILGEGLLPFTTTPINILRRGMEYSPIGLVQGVYWMARGKKAEIGTTEVIDRLASGITGTAGLMALGIFLSSLGLLRAAPDDDGEETLEQLQGYQDYSINIGNINYTIDWMAPIALPLFMGAVAYDLFSGGMNVSGWEIGDMMLKIAEPLSSLSMLDGLNSTLKTLSTADDNAMFATLAVTILGSYVTQGLPTLGSQLARTLDDTTRTTYVDKNSKVPAYLQKWWQSSVIGKIPTLTQNRAAKIDRWGRKDTSTSVLARALENFLSPGYFNVINRTPVDAELARLYELSGSKDIIPKYAAKSYGVNGNNKNLTAEEFDFLATSQGQTAYAVLAEMFASEMYQNMSYQDQIAAIASAYDYAGQVSKNRLTPEYSTDNWIETASNFGVADYVMMKADIADNNTNDALFELAITNPYLDTVQQAQLIATKYSAPKTIGSGELGYRYQLEAPDRERLEEIYNEQFVDAYDTLIQSTTWQRADTDERINLVNDIRSEVSATSQSIFATQLAQTGRDRILGTASGLTNAEAYGFVAEHENLSLQEQLDWLHPKIAASKTIDNPARTGYCFSLTGDQQRDLKETMYKAFDTAYTEMISSPAYKGYSRDEKAKAVNQLVNSIEEECELRFGEKLTKSGNDTSRKSSMTYSDLYTVIKEDNLSTDEAINELLNKYTGSTSINKQTPTPSMITYQREVYEDILYNGGYGVPSYESAMSKYENASRDEWDTALEKYRGKANTAARNATAKKFGVTKSGISNPGDDVDPDSLAAQAVAGAISAPNTYSAATQSTPVASYRTTNKNSLLYGLPDARMVIPPKRVK